MIKVALDITIIYTIIAYTIAFSLIWFVKDVKYDKKQISIKNSFKNLLLDKNMFVFIFVIALMSEVNHAVCIFLNQPKYMNVGISVVYFGIITVIMQILNLVCIKAYALSKKLGEKIILFFYIYDEFKLFFISIYAK